MIGQSPSIDDDDNDGCGMDDELWLFYSILLEDESQSPPTEKLTDGRNSCGGVEVLWRRGISRGSNWPNRYTAECSFCTDQISLLTKTSFIEFIVWIFLFSLINTYAIVGILSMARMEWAGKTEWDRGFGGKG